MTAILFWSFICDLRRIDNIRMACIAMHGYHGPSMYKICDDTPFQAKRLTGN